MKSNHLQNDCLIIRVLGNVGYIYAYSLYAAFPEGSMQIFHHIEWFSVLCHYNVMYIQVLTEYSTDHCKVSI